MMVIKDIPINRDAGKIRVFIYEEGSRAGIQLPSGLFVDFTLKETWEMSRAFTAAARILEAVNKDKEDS